ncbi:hypothetical protein [Sphingomonas sp. S2-65]|uniref:hypothetical protein n=1 Tax=Sphingomonas sp. S2-65 TaxID=2903960 RepID=UPI001F301D43|nr:hypothetical protein [Sphingomonas sp. S2-65]UYY60081.1 hypothetical protein LZ586_08395 [Sphingomonas sp. S2-65]
MSDDNKDDLVRQIVPQAIFSLDRMGQTPGAPLADDFIDLFSRACAMMLAADTNLNTSQKLRLGAEAVSSHVLRHLKRYRAYQDEHGGTVLGEILEENPVPDVVKQAWLSS